MTNRDTSTGNKYCTISKKCDSGKRSFNFASSEIVDYAKRPQYLPAMTVNKIDKKEVSQGERLGRLHGPWRRLAIHLEAVH